MRPFGPELGIEAAAVVGHAQHSAPILPRHLDFDTVRAGVLDDVAKGLLGGAEEKCFHLRWQLAVGLDAEARCQSARRAGREQVAEGGLQALSLQLRRIDLDEQASQLPDPLPRLARSVTVDASSGGAELAAAERAYETPARFCTTPSWRSPAIRRRSSS